MRHVLAAKFLDAMGNMGKQTRGGTVAIAGAFLPPTAKQAAIQIGERRPQAQSNSRERLSRRRG